MMPTRLALPLILAASAFGQVVNFDVQGPACGYAFPTSCPGSDPEGIVFNGALTFDVPAFGATVAAANGLGMPCSGQQFLRLQCANTTIGTNNPAGGPINPAGGFARLFIPIPAGATAVSFCWDFYSAEYVNAAYNDAVAVDVVSACGGGSVLASLVYADTHTPGLIVATDSTACGVLPYIPAAGVHELGPAGPQSVTNVPLPAGSAYLRVTAANGFDNAATSQIVIDAVAFGISCVTTFTSPFGAGSVMMTNTACPPLANTAFFTAISLSQGAFPNGWWFGVDLPLPQLLNLFTLGPPFTGTLNGVGSSASPAFSGLPPGLTLWAVTTEWSPGYGAFFHSRPAVVYTIP
jgi:hypothetical protein